MFAHSYVRSMAASVVKTSCKLNGDRLFGTFGVKTTGLYPKVYPKIDVQPGFMRPFVPCRTSSTY
jgi:hypothetical protein